MKLTLQSRYQSSLLVRLVQSLHYGQTLTKVMPDLGRHLLILSKKLCDHAEAELWGGDGCDVHLLEGLQGFRIGGRLDSFLSVRPERTVTQLNSTSKQGLGLYKKYAGVEANCRHLFQPSYVFLSLHNLPWPRCTFH
jgi:hypothetical protein